MSIFGNKPLYKYSILERYRKGLDGCTPVGGNLVYCIYTIKYGSTTYLLRQKRSQPQNVVFLGSAYKHVVVSQNTIFTINPRSNTNQVQHPLFLIDIETGDRTTSNLLSDKMQRVELRRNDGVLSVHSYCQDVVDSLDVKNGDVILTVDRYRSDANNVKEFTYHIRLHYDGKRYVTEYDYPDKKTVPNNPSSPNETSDKPTYSYQLSNSDEPCRKEPLNWRVNVVWRDQAGKITCPGDACPQKECDDTCPIWLKTIAHGLTRIQEYDKAIETYKEALKIAPDYYEAQNNLGTTYGMSGQDQKAYETFLAVHKANPRYANALQGLIVAETNLGMREEALAHCDELDQLPGCDSRQLREKLQPREESNNDSYMKIASELLEIGKEEGFIPQGNSFPHVPELIMMCTGTCRQLIEEIRAYGKTDPNANVSRLSLMWCAYAGMGAVYHWHFNWGELSKDGVFNTLVNERGIEDMDEYVHDCIGKPYSSKEGQQLVSHLRFMADKRLYHLASQKILDFPHFLESAKAMYVYGMVFELHELGMH